MKLPDPNGLHAMARLKLGRNELRKRLQKVNDGLDACQRAWKQIEASTRLNREQETHLLELKRRIEAALAPYVEL